MDIKMTVEKNRFLLKTRISIGQFYEGKPESLFVELREPNTLELFALKDKWALSKGDNSKAMLALVDILPDIICAHNIYQDEKTLWPASDVAEMIISKIDMFEHVVLEYYDKVLFIIMPVTEQGKASEEVRTDSSET